MATHALYQVHILRDDAGKQTIPSIVGYVNEQTVYTGHTAERQIKTNPHRTIYDAKRFIGKNFTQVRASILFTVLRDILYFKF